MQTVDFHSLDRSTFKHWFIVHSFTTLPKEDQEKYFKEYKDGKVTFDFKVNGCEINALEVIDEMENQYDAMTLESAKRLIEERIGDVFWDLEKIKNGMFDKLGIEYDRW